MCTWHFILHGLRGKKGLTCQYLKYLNCITQVTFYKVAQCKCK